MRLALVAASAILLAGCATSEAPAVLASASVASNAPVPPTAFAPNCSTEKHRQFDFWIGEWQVTGPGGKIAGENRIESILSGCALQESYKTAGPYRGFSFNMYDAGRDVWHQTWVDNGGLLLRIEGQFANGVMSLEGELPGQDGNMARHRIQWTPNPDGTVRQHWQSRPLGEPDWQTVFDGLYTRKDVTGARNSAN